MTRIEELEISNEHYKIVLNQLDSTIFEYSVVNGTVSYCTNFSRIFGSKPVIETFPQSMVEGHIIHPDDVTAFQSLFEKIRGGAPSAEGEFRLKNAQNSYLWCRFKITTIYNDDSNIPVRAIGQINDITCQKQETQDLMQKAQHDELTGLLNKAATQHFVESALTCSTLCALYIIDVDHFKNINDNLGHMFGDTVLTEVGGCLKRLFRASDIVGRIGGDEFMVLMKDIGDPFLIREKAEALNQCLNQTFCGQIDAFTISGSIGVAVFPQDGTTYADLYKKADTALYSAKRSGRNSYVIFDSETENEASHMSLPVPQQEPLR